MATLIGQTVSHYKILEHLGGGGMGVVYKAQDLKLDRPVALKFLPPDLTRDPEAKQRFVHEAKAASSLQHTNICTVHDIDETSDGQLFIVMDFYEGETLKKKIERGPLKIEAAVDTASQVAYGLINAHEHGIIHRDIKPANIMITTDGVAKIVDFGLAKLTGRTMLTRTGSTLGTAAYMSPEQARAEPADQRTDIWSLGVLLYEMISGKRPFEADYENALLYSIINAEPEPITGLRTGVPMEIERIINKCLAKSPKERYQHADELIVDLRGIHPVSASLLPATSRTGILRDRKIWTRLVFAASALIVVALGAWFFLGREAGETSQLRKKSIAVLPFSPFGRTFDDTVFADGIHDDILTQLSKISGLRVIDRQSMVLYRNSKKPTQQIANELDVAYLLEGSTRRSGGKIRITAQLIKTAEAGQIWADSYDRNDADLFAVQSDIAQRIASSMETALSPSEKAAVEEIPTTNAEAYKFYLQGNYYYDNYVDSAGNAKAAECYEKAAQIDPAFTQAFARAAESSIAVRGFGDRTPARFAGITSALEKARGLNPEDPVVHSAQGWYLLNCDTVRGRIDRLNLALQEFQNGLRSRPNWAALYLGVGIVLQEEGALREAREAFRKLFSLNPMALSSLWDPWTNSSWLKEWDVARREVDQYIAHRPDDPYAYTSKSNILINGFGDLEGARAVLKEGLKLPRNQYRAPGFEITARNFWFVTYLEGKYQEALACLADLPPHDVSGWIQKGETYEALNQHSVAMACFDSALSFTERLPALLKHRLKGTAFAWRGHPQQAVLEFEKAGRALERFERVDMIWGQRKVLEESEVRSVVLAGDTGRAMSLLEKLLAEPGNLTVWELRLDPVYNPLRSDPRFQALLAKDERTPTRQ